MTCLILGEKDSSLQKIIKTVVKFQKKMIYIYLYNDRLCEYCLAIKCDYFLK